MSPNSHRTFPGARATLLLTIAAAVSLLAVPQNVCGQIFIANVRDNTVGEYSLDGTVINASLITGLTFPVGVAVSGGFLYVTNSGATGFGDGFVGKYTIAGAAVNASLITGLASPVGVVVSEGNIFVAEVGNQRIGKYTTSGATVNAALVTGLSIPQGLALSGTNLFVANGGGTIGEYTTVGAIVNASLVAGLDTQSPQSVAVEGSHIFVATFNNGTVGEYNLDGTVVNASLLTGFQSPQVSASGTNVFVADTLANKVGKYTTSGATVNASLITGLNHPTEPTIAPGKLLNISTRADVQTGPNVAIGGFIVTGSDPKTVIVRGIGPSLTQPGLAGVLQNPTLELHDASGAVIAQNDDWRVTQIGGVITTDQQTEIQDSGVAPSNDLESALIAVLPANNASYTVVLRGAGASSGTGLVEVYDLSQTAKSTLANISTRGFVGIDNNLLIGGVIVGGGDSNIIVRAIGPSLTAAGVVGTLQDPVLELHNGSGTIIASNDNWKDTQQAAVFASGIAPTVDAESAIVTKVPAGNYTAIVRGKNNTTGVALVEAYDLQ